MTGLQEEAKPAASRGEQPPNERPIRFDLADPFDNVSLDDGKNYRAFVRSLMSRVEGRLADKLDDDIQMEVAKTIQLLAGMRRKVVAANRVYFKLIFDIIGAGQPNLILARSIRRDITDVSAKKYVVGASGRFSGLGPPDVGPSQPSPNRR